MPVVAAAAQKLGQGQLLEDAREAVAEPLRLYHRGKPLHRPDRAPVIAELPVVVVLDDQRPGIVVGVMVVEGADAINWYDLHTEGREPIPTANRMHVEDGRITAIRAVFDPRPILG